jgi:hypothetical protein
VAADPELRLVGRNAGRSRRSRTDRSRADAERFIWEVCGDEPELARLLRIEERELEAGGLN